MQSIDVLNNAMLAKNRYSMLVFVCLMFTVFK